VEQLWSGLGAVGDAVVRPGWREGHRAGRKKIGHCIEKGDEETEEGRRAMRRLGGPFLCVVLVIVASAAVSGATWEVFTTKDGLPSNEVTALFVDADNTLWIGTAAAGIAHFDGSRFRWYAGAFGRGSIRKPLAICRRGDELWMTGFDGTGWLDLRTKLWDWPPAPEGYNGVGIAAAEDGTLYVATVHAVSCMRADEVIFCPIKWAPSFIDVFLCLLLTSESTVYAPSRDGNMYVFRDCELVDCQPVDQRLGSFDQMAEDTKGCLWALHRLGWCYYQCDPPDGEWKRLEVTGDELCTALACGPENTVAVGTLEPAPGACVMPATGPGDNSARVWVRRCGRWRRYDQSDGLPLSWVSALAIDRDLNVWAGTRGAGLALLRSERPPLPDAFVGISSEPQIVSVGDRMTVHLDAVTESIVDVDLYVALDGDAMSGGLLFWPWLSPSAQPFLSGLHLDRVTIHGYELFSLTLPDLPEGTYRWFAACTYAGTMDLASNIASCEWEFEK